MNRSKYIFFLFIFLLGFLSCKTATESIPQSAESITQLVIPRVDEMPNMPAPYMMKDWKKTALEFDKYVYNFDEKGPFMPMIWMDTMKRNFPQNTYGLYTALGDVREGPNVNDGESNNVVWYDTIHDCLRRWLECQLLPRYVYRNLHSEVCLFQWQKL